MQALLAKEKLLASGEDSGKGHNYLRYVEGIWQKSNFDLTEEGYIEYAKGVYWPFILSFVIGYASLLILLFIMIWSG